MNVPTWTVKLFEDHVRRHYFPNGEPLADMDIIDPVWAEKHRQDLARAESELLSTSLSPLGVVGRTVDWFKFQAYSSIRDG